MIHKEFWGILFLIFVGWIFIPGHPSTRIEHACRPVGWTGNVVTSLSALVLDEQQSTVQKWFSKLEYGCQYTVWRLMYQEDYNKWQAKQSDERSGKKGDKKGDVEKDGAPNESPASTDTAPPAPPKKSDDKQ